jgi:ribonuclease HI
MYQAFFDGACRGNPGPMSISLVIYDPDGERIAQHSRQIGYGTNNVAEYSALIELLRCLTAIRIERVQIFGDSQLVVNQVTNRWRINEPHLKDLANQAFTLMKGHPGWSISWIPRERNAADGVSTDTPDM